MARTYKRDARGRFSGGGGGSSGGGGGKKASGGGGKKAASSGEAKASPRIGRKYDAPAAKPKAEPKAKGGGSKAAATKAANKANTERLTAMGQTGIGSRLKKSTAKSYSGTKATKDKMAQSWANSGSNKREDGSGANFSKARQRGTMSKKRGK
jgi:hypothetical protein